jgi:hypothetical protein
VRGGDDEVDAEEALARAQAFVAENDSYRFEVTTKNRLTTGDPDGPGSESTWRSVTSGEVEGPDRWLIVTGSAEPGFDDVWTEHVLRLGTRLYLKRDDAGLAEDAPPWIELPAPSADELADESTFFVGDAEELDGTELGEDPYIDSMVVESVVGAYLLDFEQEPKPGLRIVSEAEGPVVEEELADGSVRLRAQLAPDEEALASVVDAVGEELPPVSVVLHTAEDGRLIDASFEASIGSATAQVDLVYSDWGQVTGLEAPSPDQVDQTPWLDEESIRDADAVLRVAPASPPDGLVLSGVYAYRGSGEDFDCDSVSVQYDDPAMVEGTVDPESTDELPYLYISTYDAACWLVDDPEPFDELLGGLPARDFDGSWEVRVGDGVVALDGNLSDEQLDAVARSLGPVSAETLIAAAPALPMA